MSQKILIIDDEPHLVEILANRLHSAGYEVVSAGSGEIGLEKARTEKPDLILLDVLMPDLDGYEVLRHLKGAVQTRSIPVMMLTVKKWSEDIQKSITGGAADYIVKPFHPAKLLERVKKVMK